MTLAQSQIIHVNERGSIVGTLTVLAFGIAINFIANGYQFGLSNHSVYLIDALRRTDPTLLANDWFYTQTLQYHSIFGWLTAGLLKLRILEPAFAVIYAVMLIVLHIGWRSIVRRLGGDDRAYLLSVILYFLSAGGIGLGMYQFFQDSTVLASNIANVAMLAGIAGFIGGRWLAAGFGLAVATLFHLNHAAVAVLLWIALAMVENRLDLRRWMRPGFLIATLILAAAAAANIVPAAIAKLDRPGSIPLAEFVDLYARLRHPHHYDPSTWPLAVWLAFCIWIPPAATWIWLVARRGAQPEFGRVIAVVGAVMGLQIVALVFAGIVYVSETLVQLSLFRFSIIAHLIMVILASLLLSRWRQIEWLLPALMAFALLVTLLSPMSGVAIERIGPIAALILLGGLAPLTLRRIDSHAAVGVGALVMLVALLFSRNVVTGLTRPLVKIDADYRALCRWVSDPANTPLDAVFLTPPTDEELRWFGRRAIVVNWKSMTQLAPEIPEWRDRMAASLGWSNLDALPRGSYIRAIAAMNMRYDQVDGKLLFNAARKYGARFVVATRHLGEEFDRYRVAPPFGRYLLYEVSR